MEFYRSDLVGSLEAQITSCPTLNKLVSDIAESGTAFPFDFDSQNSLEELSSSIWSRKTWLDKKANYEQVFAAAFAANFK